MFRQAIKKIEVIGNEYVVSRFDGQSEQLVHSDIQFQGQITGQQKITTFVPELNDGDILKKQDGSMFQYGLKVRERDGVEASIVATFDATNGVQYTSGQPFTINGWNMISTIDGTISIDYTINENLVGSTIINNINARGYNRIVSYNGSILLLSNALPVYAIKPVYGDPITFIMDSLGMVARDGTLPLIQSLITLPADSIAGTMYDSMLLVIDNNFNLNTYAILANMEIELLSTIKIETLNSTTIDISVISGSKLFIFDRTTKICSVVDLTGLNFTNIGQLEATVTSASVISSGYLIVIDGENIKMANFFADGSYLPVDFNTALSHNMCAGAAVSTRIEYENVIIDSVNNFNGGNVLDMCELDGKHYALTGSDDITEFTGDLFGSYTTRIINLSMPVTGIASFGGDVLATVFDSKNIHRVNIIDGTVSQYVDKSNNLTGANIVSISSTTRMLTITMNDGNVFGYENIFDNQVFNVIAQGFTVDSDVCPIEAEAVWMSSVSGMDRNIYKVYLDNGTVSPYVRISASFKTKMFTSGGSLMVIDVDGTHTLKKYRSKVIQSI